jgi:hypothetical protein
MSPLVLTSGEGLILWVRERSLLAVGTPLAELRQSFHGVGLACETRFDSNLGPWELVITHPGTPTPSVSEPLPTNLSRDVFRLEIHTHQILLSAVDPRGFAYGIWELMERMGWRWLTPQITREPQQSQWSFEPESLIYTPQQATRILFFEQVELLPSLVRWFAHLRFNVLFPSHPNAFIDPESQIPEESLILANDLGLEIVVGGDCLSWLTASLELEKPPTWQSLSPKELDRLVAITLEMWDEMPEPKPYLSIRHEGHETHHVSRFVEHLAAHDERIPFRAEYEYFPVSQWDEQLANTLLPFLWKGLNQWIERPEGEGAGKRNKPGICLGFRNLNLATLCERNGTAWGVLAHSLWNPVSTAWSQAVKDLLIAQYETNGELVHLITTELEHWAEERTIIPPNDAARCQKRSPHHGVYSPHFETAHSFLETEERRDHLDQRLTELEECPPSESNLEFARSLAILVGLYDLEECSDIHESKALARTLWRQTQIDQWPPWLKECSPFAERLRKFF